MQKTTYGKASAGGDAEPSAMHVRVLSERKIPFVGESRLSDTEAAQGSDEDVHVLRREQGLSRLLHRLEKDRKDLNSGP